MNLEKGIKLQPILSREEQYLELANTVKCTIKPSPIHGVGVFALRDIKAGDRCYLVPGRVEWLTLTLKDLDKFDKVYPEIKRMILDRWPTVVNGTQFLSPNFDVRLTGFINHSDSPSYDIVTDTALKDIKSGEELTEDYRIMENWELAFPWLKQLSPT